MDFVCVAAAAASASASPAKSGGQMEVAKDYFSFPLCGPFLLKYNTVLPPSAPSMHLLHLRCLRMFCSLFFVCACFYYPFGLAFACMPYSHLYF